MKIIPAVLCVLLVVSGGRTQVVEHERARVVDVANRAGGEIVNMSKNSFGFDDPIVWEPENGLASYFYDDINFEITSDKTKTMEVVLFVANHWEERIWLSIKSSNDDDSQADPHILADACCFDFTDECRQQTYFQYTLPPFIKKHSKYQARIALRVQARFPTTTSLVGKWTVRISNKLPDRITNAHVRLEVYQKTYGYWDVVAVVMVVAIACVAGMVVLWDFLSNKLSQTRVIRPGSDDDERRVPVSRKIGELFLKVKEIVSGLRTSLAGRYSEMREEGGGGTGGGEEEEGEEDEEKVCRICRCTQPEGELFSPCDCRGSVRYVHRTCLEEWREKTTNQENKVKCSECKAPFTIAVTQTNKRWDFAKAALKTGGVALLQLLLIETALVMVGYLYKTVIGLITFDMGNINWYVNLYHHVVAVTVILALQFHALLLGGFLKLLIPPHLAVWRYVILVVSLLFEVVAGYFGHFLLWCLNTTVWEWQVHYCTGFALIFLYTLFIHDSVTHAYQRWKSRYVVQHVIEPTDREERGVPPIAPTASPNDVNETTEPSTEGQTVMNEELPHSDSPRGGEESGPPPAPVLTHAVHPVLPLPPPLSQPSLD